MAKVDVSELGIGVQIRGKIGAPSLYGTREYGTFEYGAGAKYYGIYQVRTEHGKQVQVRMKFYVPSNPQTEAQQAWRNTFAAGVSSWQGLSEEDKDIYRERAKHLPLTGFNLYMREYLLT